MATVFPGNIIATFLIICHFFMPATAAVQPLDEAYIIEQLTTHAQDKNFDFFLWYQALPPVLQNSSLRSIAVTFLDNMANEMVHATDQKPKDVLREEIQALPFGYLQNKAAYLFFKKYGENVDELKIDAIWAASIEHQDYEYLSSHPVAFNNCNISNLRQIAALLTIFHDMLISKGYKPLWGLNLESNNLTDINHIFRAAPALRYLNLSNNKQLLEIDCLYRLQQLTYLFFNGCDLISGKNHRLDFLAELDYLEKIGLNNVQAFEVKQAFNKIGKYIGPDGTIKYLHPLRVSNKNTAYTPRKPNKKTKTLTQKILRRTRLSGHKNYTAVKR